MNQNETKVLTGPPSPTLAAHKMRRWRKRAGMTAEQLGESLGVSQAAVIYWEHGQRTPRPAMQKVLLERGICEPNDWHQPAPLDEAA